MMMKAERNTKSLVIEIRNLCMAFHKHRPYQARNAFVWPVFSVEGGVWRGRLSRFARVCPEFAHLLHPTGSENYLGKRSSLGSASTRSSPSKTTCLGFTVNRVFPARVSACKASQPVRFHAAKLCR